MAQKANKRSLKNIFINHQLQLKYGFVIFLFVVCLIISLISLLNFISIVQDGRALGLSGLSMGSLAIVLAAVVYFLLGSLLLGALITHRFIGPQIPIKRHLQRMIDGNYSEKVRLRNKDELQELATLLNQLTEKLDQREREV